INYDSLSNYAWLIIIFAYLSFLLGILVYFTAIRIFPQKNIEAIENLPLIFSYNGSILKYIIIFFSIIGLVGAIQHWSILLAKYGTIVEVFLHLGRIRQLTTQGEIEGILPYISSFAFVAIFFAGLYSAFKNRLTLISFLPMFVIIIKDTAAAGRVGILIGFIEYGLAFILTLYYLKSIKTRQQISNKFLNYFSIGIIIIIFFASIFFIKGLRGGSEDLYGAGRNISSFSDNIFITPTLYLYFSGHVGVLSRYLEKEDETARFGENTFRFAYNILNKLGITEEAEMYQRGYYIPVWINTGTFLRELHADFGIGGTLLFLFLLGIIVSFTWLNFYKTGNIYYLIFLVHFCIILAMSFLMMVTRLTHLSISLITILMVNYLLNKILFLKTDKLGK
ncbi:MAG: oligosaccharide repeat unit polymerase, partial [Nanoarchaeota archaeon]|nr:oligosaccharide repeat unit polymerase [Nanoarchaeota archaeon]